MTNKRKLHSLICKDLNHIIHHLHIFSVINILIEEIIKELKSGNEIDIGNFGIFSIKELRPKKIISLTNREVKFVDRTKVLRFKIARKLTKLIKNKQ
jgi:nucleoid DNA-binding protein